ncbi:MAG: putative sgc region protein SgcQ [candidate division WS6 bacterium OLB20]|uniref:Putative sgc region protein SgcQ n=1 Tax=candidate division WS6 bacterium OLB20 TaxID=1617426 RepID=A0A136LWN8_9BACT|nr:MAG: putative sgc region protein SgcQ [candidate division WS6 bacterium OLB20]
MKIFTDPYPVIGMIHLDAQEGTPGFAGYKTMTEHTQQDIGALQEGGISAIMLENDNDKPYSEFISDRQYESMSRLSDSVRNLITVPLGYTILLNDWKAALRLAAGFGAAFIRLDTFVDTVKRVDDGIVIDPDPEEIIDFRDRICPDVLVFTDVHVKHTTMVDTARTLEQSVADAIAAGSDGIVVTGSWTGSQPDLDELNRVRRAVNGKVPVLIGSGMNAGNAALLKTYSDGAIVGSSLKSGDRIDPDNVRALMSALA